MVRKPWTQTIGDKPYVDVNMGENTVMGTNPMCKTTSIWASRWTLVKESRIQLCKPMWTKKGD